MKFEYDFTVGDLVRIKDYDDIVSLAESVEPDGSFYITSEEIWFASGMKQHCGKEFRVKGFSQQDGHVMFEEDSKIPYRDSIEYYIFSPSMVEPANVKQKESADEGSIGEFILG